jgi:hypothetical protein
MSWWHVLILGALACASWASWKVYGRLCIATNALHIIAEGQLFPESVARDALRALGELEGGPDA